MRPGTRTARWLLPASLLLLTAGCGGSQDALAPKSHQSQDIATLFWWMLGVAAVGLALVVGLLVWSTRRRPPTPGDPWGKPGKPSERGAWYVVVGAGIVMPVVLIASLFVISDIFVIRTTQAPAAGSTKLTVLVVGHQWWWEVRYPGTKAVTANEIHIPARTPVLLQARTADVIHSVWVPRLNRKIDTIPGQTNEIELYADTPGRYRGQCAEFCGLQHAHMAMYVYADPPAVFRRWLAGQERPASPPASAEARRGQQVFLSGSCADCHAIRGTSASGYVGPDLTHLASRNTIGALTAPLGDADLRQWITGSQHLKPGNQMPDINLAEDDVRALVTYLKGLK